MALLSWSDQYLIGDLTIDTEHKELFQLVNAFHDNWIEKRNVQDIAKVLNQLVVYVQMHFRHEEIIMEKAAYPKLDEHKQIHESMVDTIFRLCQSFEDKNLHLEMETMKFVKAWLVDHILQNDYQFRDFLARKKSTPEPIPH